MTTIGSPQIRSSERGSALIGVLLLLMMMSALAGALTVSGHTETLVARNHQTAAQARAAAEAGLNHATEVVLAWLLSWKDNGFPNVDTALDTLLAGVEADAAYLDGITFSNPDPNTAVTVIT